MKYSIPFILLIICSFGCNKDVEKIKPKLEVITESVYASVIIQPEKMYEVFSSVPGVIEEIYVEEGDAVSKGQPIAKIKSSASENALADAVSNGTLAKNNYLGSSSALNSLREEETVIAEQLSVDSMNFTRQQRLWNQDIGSRSQLENMKLKYEQTSSRYAASKQKIEQLENELKTHYQRSLNVVKNAELVLDDHSVKSLIDGKIYALFKENGESISTIQPLAQIGRNNSFVIEMLIDEVDVASVRLGQKVYVKLDAYTDAVYEAHVTKIYPIKNPQNQTFKLEATFLERPEMLYAGLSGEANIVISEKKESLTIPLDVLIEENKVQTDQGEIELKLGIRSNDRIEVLSGLDSSTVILKAP